MSADEVELVVSAINVMLGVVLLRRGQRLSLQFSQAPHFLSRESRFCSAIGLVILMLAMALLIMTSFELLRLLD